MITCNEYKGLINVMFILNVSVPFVNVNKYIHDNTLKKKQ